LLLIACAIVLSTTRAAASVVFVSLDDNGQEFTLERGDALEVSLPATSGTGFTWQAAPIAGGIVTQVGDPEFKGGSAMPGGSGRQVFHFARGAVGIGTLEMHYIRPWEKNTPPAKVFKIMLTVR
jgi:inhibitor of cysteine peptidase